MKNLLFELMALFTSKAKPSMALLKSSAGFRGSRYLSAF